MSIFKLIREFSKRYGRSPSPSELDKLKKQSDIIQQQDTVIPFPQGGKDRLSPFDNFKASEDAYEQSQKLYSKILWRQFSHTPPGSIIL